MKPTLCLRLSPARLMAAVTAALFLLLLAAVLRVAQTEPEATLSSPFEAALWLKDRGAAVDPEPVWEKTVFFADPPGEGEAAYFAVLEEQGFSPRDHLGRPLTLTCFRLTGKEAEYARVLTDGDVLVGADRFRALPDAPPFEPLNGV